MKILLALRCTFTNCEFHFCIFSQNEFFRKQGWFGYDFTPENNLQIGLIQVPFGITQYNSHNWFFSINYYVGMEDDHDMGVKYTHSDENRDWAL